MRSLLIILIVHAIAGAGIAYGQTPQWQWARSGVGLEYDQANAVAIGPSGNVFVTGYFSSDSIAFGGIVLHNHTPGFSDLFIVVYDPAGDVLWAHAFGGSLDDKGFALAAGADGKVHLAANFYSPTIQVGTYSFTNAGNVGDILVVSFDATGAITWATREGGPGLEIPYAIATDGDGSVIVAGRFSSNSITFGTTTLAQAGSMDVFVVKYDATGTILWAKGAGGGSNDEAYALAITSAGDVIVAGYYTQLATFGSFTLPNPGQANIFVARCDGGTGAFEMAAWIASDGDERALAVALDAVDNIYLAGFFQSDSLVFGSTILYATDTDNGFVCRLDPNGDPSWAHSLNGRSKAQGIAVSNGAVYACGVFRDTQLDFGGTTLPLIGSSDLFLLKCDLAGIPQWAVQQTSGGTGGESALALAAGPGGALAMAGNFNSATTSFGSATLTNSDGYDAFVIKVGDPGVGILEQSTGAAVSIHPNPGSGEFMIEHPGGPTLVQVADMRGTVVHEARLADGPVRAGLDLSHLAGGCYHVILSSGPDRLTGKLLIVR